jgi:DNA-binding SARP family transcriptional activator
MRLQLCGRLALLVGDARVEGKLPGRQGRLALAYLATHRQRPVRRDELLEAIWPDAAPPAADAALRALLSKLRKVLAPAQIEGRDEARLVLPPGSVIDIEHARRAIHRAESAIALGEWGAAWGPSQVTLMTARRGFMPGEDCEWVEEVRTELADLHRRALEAYGRAALELGGTELAAAERAGRALVRLEPYRESGYRLLMTALARQSNPAAAILVYEDLRKRLAEDLGIAPSETTQRVHLELLG